jgi:hypothetical protein
VGGVNAGRGGGDIRFETFYMVVVVEDCAVVVD